MIDRLLDKTQALRRASKLRDERDQAREDAAQLEMKLDKRTRECDDLRALAYEMRVEREERIRQVLSYLNRIHALEQERNDLQARMEELEWGLGNRIKALNDALQRITELEGAIKSHQEESIHGEDPDIRDGVLYHALYGGPPSPEPDEGLIGSMEESYQPLEKPTISDRLRRKFQNWKAKDDEEIDIQVSEDVGTQLGIRMTGEEADQIIEAANNAGMMISDWVRNACREKMYGELVRPGGKPDHTQTGN